MMLHPPIITFVVPCMGRLHHLRETLPLLAKQPQAEVVVVDYSDPDGCAFWVQQQGFPNVRSIIVPHQQYFNLSRARNHGAQLCQTKYVSFIDADVILREKFVTDIKPALDERYYIAFKDWSSGYSGFLICWYAAFLYAGGYPAVTPGVLYNGPDMNGYGFDDGYMRMALEKVGVQPRWLEMDLASHIGHDQQSRVARYGPSDKDISTTQPRNAEIAHKHLAKWNPYPLFGCNNQG